MGKIIIALILTVIALSCKEDRLVSSDPEENVILYIDYIDEYGENYGKGIAIDSIIWAPVNCGYKPTSVDDKGYPYGKLYQWGRKYGQGYSGTLYYSANDILNGLPIRISDATTPELIEGSVSVEMGNHESNSNVFFCESCDWQNSQIDTLWNSGSMFSPIKTKYDPCPEGWRIPTGEELNKLCQNHSLWTKNNADQLGYWFSGSVSYSEDVPQIFVPAAGFRNREGNADGRGKDGYYWASTLEDGLYSYALGIHDSNAVICCLIRAAAASIRCVQVNQSNN